MADSNATYTTSVRADFPDHASSTVKFTNEAYFISGNAEILAGKQYTLTLDANGQGTQILPCPDNTGETAVNWLITLPSKESERGAIAYDASPQNLSDILAAGSTTTDPDDIIAALANKVSKSGDTMTGDLTMSGASIVAADTIGTNTSYTTTGSESIGAMWWDADEETLNVKTNTDITLQVGQETFFNVKNQTGADITNGTPVMFAGTVGASSRLLIQEAIADGSIAPSYIMGLATEDIANGDNGKVTWFGKVRGLNTTGTPYGEVWADGDILYVSPTTAGYLTKTRPSAPDRAIEIAAVVHAHATQGSLFIRPTWAPKVTELDDVDGTPLTTNGQFLVWDNDNGYFDATANTADFVATTGDTMTGPLILDTTNTEALLVRKASDGGDVFKIDTANGLVSVGAISSPTELFEVRGEVPDYTIDTFGIRSTLTSNITSDDSTFHWSAMLAQTIQQGAFQNGAWLAAMYAYYKQDGSGTQDDVRAVVAVNRINDGVANSVHGVYSDIQLNGDAIAGNVYHYRAKPTVKNDTSAITGDEYAFYVGNLTSGVNNYALYVEGANVKTVLKDVTAANVTLTSGKVLSLDDGTNSLPSITFGNDLNCGIYRIGSDNVGFAAGGQNAFEYNALLFGIGTERAGVAMGAKLDVYQWQTAGAIPVVRLTQLDVSEEIFEITSTAGIGNAIELVGAKTLTTTEFIKVTINGATRYIPAGTIA